MDKKQLYENIMASVAKEVKKALNENEYWDEPFKDDDDFYMTDEREDSEDEQSRQILRDMVDEYTIEELENGFDEDGHPITDRITERFLDNNIEPRRWDVYDYVVDYIETKIGK